METILIIGAGQAGAEAAVALRDRGFKGHVVLAAEEPSIPYERPPLSKEMLSAESPTFSAYVRSSDYFEHEGIDLRCNDPIVDLDPVNHRAIFESGRAIVYSNCIIATGGRARSAPWLPADASRCLTLRTLADAHALRDALSDVRRILIVGGGFLGLEAASTLRVRSLDVTVVEAAPRLLSRILPAQLSAWLRERHESLGTHVICDTKVTAYEESSSGVRLLLQGANGHFTSEADLCLLAVGQEPNIDLARSAGLDVANGVCVDQFCRTSDADVYAAGDCAVTVGEGLNPTRIESWQNARDQAKVAAANALGQEQPYVPKHWFWTDQCGWNLQILGQASHPDLDWVVRDIAPDKFLLFGMRDDVIRQICAINAGGELRAAGRVLNRQLPNLKSQIIDPSFSLRRLGAA